MQDFEGHKANNNGGQTTKENINDGGAATCPFDM